MLPSRSNCSCFVPFCVYGLPMARAASSSSRFRHRPVELSPPRTGEKGRGARSNISGRYEKDQRSEFHDGWDIEEDPPQKNATIVTNENPRSIINYVESPFVHFDRSINMYRGCEHGCIYCFARPTHAYYGLSSGLDFEKRLFAKPNAAKLLVRELRAASYQPRPIAIGTNTDPYQPIERQRRLMRSVLSVLRDFKHPVSILTKSALIERDMDLIAEMAAYNGARAMLSITSLDPSLSRAMEPRACAPHKRLTAVRRLASAGIPTGVMTAPIIPGLNDHELEDLLAAAKDAGAAFVGYTVIRLPKEVAPLFREWLESAFPHRAARVMRHIRDMNGGRDYDPDWSRARAPREETARLIQARFRAARRRLSFAAEIPELSTAHFRPPVEKGDQLALFQN